MTAAAVRRSCSHISSGAAFPPNLMLRRARSARLEAWVTGAVLVPMLRDATLWVSPQHEVGVVPAGVRYRQILRSGRRSEEQFAP